MASNSKKTKTRRANRDQKIAKNRNKKEIARRKKLADDDTVVVVR